LAAGFTAFAGAVFLAGAFGLFFLTTADVLTAEAAKVAVMPGRSGTVSKGQA
jgi:hypothetical protein